MKITKFEHACFVAELDGQSLVVDPGDYTTDLVIPDNVVAVVITHKHNDHLGMEHIQNIIGKNPEAIIVAHEEVLEELDDYKTQAAVANQGMKIGNFELEFFGGNHAMIFSSVPIISNLGVMINDTVYYPGDSFTVPDKEVKILALPAAAPWLKFSEIEEFLTAVKPSVLAFPTHDAILSEGGKNLPDRMLPGLVEKSGAKYQRLHEPLDI